MHGVVEIITGRERPRRWSAADRQCLVAETHEAGTAIRPSRHATASARACCSPGVAKMLGEDQDWLWDVALGMEPEDGCLFVYGVTDEATLAFTRDGIDNLKELIEIHKANPDIIAHYHHTRPGEQGTS